MTRSEKILKKFLIWRIKNVKHQHFILILSMIVGMLSGMLAVTIKNLAHYIQQSLTELDNLSLQDYGYLIYPLIGIAISGLIIKHFFQRDPGQGIATILYSISKNNGVMKRRSAFSSFFTSILTVGFGGSVGLEAPAAVSASSLSSLLSKALHLNYKNRLLMIGCAASGTLAAIFDAPVAAIVFAFEVFMLDLTTASLIPLLFASALAAISSNFFAGDELLVRVDLVRSFEMSHIPYVIVLGVFAGLLSAFFSFIYFKVGGLFEKIEKKRYRIIIGGLMLGCLLFFFPVLYGEGYGSINLMLGNNLTDLDISFFQAGSSFWLLIFILILTVILKALATAITVGAGGVGGIFAPTMFMGSILGYIFSKISNHFEGSIESNHFTLLGMAALVSGILHAPLTAIFLVAEITGGYELFIPLMVVVSIAYLTSKYFVEHSIYNSLLASRGELVTHHKDKAVLNRIHLSKMLETNFCKIKPEMTLGELVNWVANSSRNIFPVVDDEDNFMGIVVLDDIRQIMFDRSQYDKRKVHELMHAPSGQIQLEDSMETVMTAFKVTGAWNLVVLCNGRYCGFVSKAKIFTVYRRILVEFSEE